MALIVAKQNQIELFMKTPISIDEFINITKKDIDEFDEYMKSRMNYRASIAKERILNPDKNTLPQSVANLPECLIHLWVSLTYNKEEDEAFAKYPKKIIEVNSVEELFAKMMSER